MPNNKSCWMVVVIAAAACAEAPERGLTLTTADGEHGIVGEFVADDGTALALAVQRDDSGQVGVLVRAGTRLVVEFVSDDEQPVLRVAGVDLPAALSGDAEARRAAVAFAATREWAAYLALRDAVRVALAESAVDLTDLVTALDVPTLAMAALIDDSGHGRDQFATAASPTCGGDTQDTDTCGQSLYLDFVEGASAGDTVSCTCGPSVPTTDPTTPLPREEAGIPDQLEHHPSQCLGECGLGCAGIGGLHYCTAACNTHDLCVRNKLAMGVPAWLAHGCCANGLKAAAASFAVCVANPAGCWCPGPHN